MTINKPNESVFDKFLRENPGYEIFNIECALDNGFELRMVKGSYHFSQIISWGDIARTKTQTELIDMFEKIFDLGKCKIEEKIATEK